MQEENVVEHHHALTITESESVDSCVATVLEEQFIGNHGKHSHLDVVDGKKRSLIKNSSGYSPGVGGIPRRILIITTTWQKLEI